MMRPIKYCIATALALSAVAWAGQPAITGAAAEKSVIVQTNSAVNPVTQYGIVIVAVPQATVYADPALTPADRPTIAPRQQLGHDCGRSR